MNQFKLIKLNTFNINGETKIIYENIEYLCREFIVNNRHNLEIEILEYDHLTEKELRNSGKLLEDEIYESKKANVSQIGSEKTMRKEVLKCQLVCHECHVYATIAREKGGKKLANNHKLKYDYVCQLKSKGCVLCGYINIEIPRFFDMDHINPAEKKFGISKKIANKLDFETFKSECDKCRVLCRYCHIIHTRNQINEGINFTIKNL